MSDKTYPYDADLPYVVEHTPTHQVVARFQADHWASEFAETRRFPDEFEVIHTTPKPRVPKNARYVTWCTSGYRCYAERVDDEMWTAGDGYRRPLEDLPGVTPETTFTVLEERKS